MSISLNSHTKEGYDAICHSVFGLDAFDEMLNFTKQCVSAGIETIVSVVDVEGVDVEACRVLASQAGAKLKVREYIK
jgi:hypothetical protein